MQRASNENDEVEVKLPFPSVDEARRCIEALGATPDSERRLQDDRLFDRDGELSAGRRVLRLRRAGETSKLTYKGPDRDRVQHKVREEREVAVDDADEAQALLCGLGYAPSFRYQKYRTTYRLGDLEVCLDETPLGCFVELEGAPDAIDGAARRLGFTPDRYVRDSYLELHEREVRAGRRPEGDLVFDPPAGEAPSR